MNRRNFIQNTATAGMLGIPMVNYSEQTESQNKDLDLPKGLRVLLQGDSITDAGRDKARYYANDAQGMGWGYVYQIVAELLGSYPESDLQCFNRGISGHKVYQLADRWQLDCLGIKPDVLSILIGVNDYWHMLNGKYEGSAEIYERDYRALLRRTKEELPDVKLIICEPFAVEGGTAIDEKWKPFDDYRASAQKLATEFDTAFVPFHSVLNDALSQAPASYWSPDGVHPSIAGAYLMKQAWMVAFEEIMK